MYVHAVPVRGMERLRTCMGTVRPVRWVSEPVGLAGSDCIVKGRLAGMLNGLESMEWKLDVEI